MENFIVFAIIIATFTVIFAIRAYVRHRRTEAVKKIAARELGWEFFGDGNHNIPTFAWDLNLFSKGRSQQVRNLIYTQQEEASIFIFDYQYQQGSRKNRLTDYQTVVLFESDTLALPRFLLIPENIFHKIGQLFGYQDIDFSEHPQFSWQYLLRGDCKDKIRQLFNYRVISLYESRQGVSTEGINTLLVYYYAKKSQEPKTWKAFIEKALDVYRLFKTRF
ncbi:MAG: hypothetical protein F6K14_28475 [Symploca sp. SIO2C1]|nr:hypothetical protein [Symploca sp. SIO2C1]